MTEHRHAASSEWAAYGAKRVQHPIRNGLNVYLEHESRHLYPAGANAPVCCTEERTVLRVYGELATARDVRLVLAKLADLQDQIKPVMRHG